MTTKEKLKAALEDAISEAVSGVSYDTGSRFFIGEVKISVDEGWTRAEVTNLKITE